MIITYSYHDILSYMNKYDIKILKNAENLVRQTNPSLSDEEVIVMRDMVVQKFNDIYDAVLTDEKLKHWEPFGDDFYDDWGQAKSYPNLKNQKNSASS